MAGNRRIAEEKPFYAVPGIGLFRNTKRQTQPSDRLFSSDGFTTGTEGKCIRIIVLMIDTLVRHTPLKGPTDMKLLAPHTTDSSVQNESP